MNSTVNSTPQDAARAKVAKKTTNTVVRFGKKEVPKGKNIFVSLTHIYGIGKSSSRKIIAECNISPSTKPEELTDEQTRQIRQIIGDRYVTEDKLKENQKKLYDLLVRLGTTRGKRREARLPCRGQRTRRNARTAKGRKRATVANKKAAPSPK
jgi:small subunit ribosomal protein S13